MDDELRKNGCANTGVIPDDGLALLTEDQPSEHLKPVWISEDKTIPKTWLHPNGFATFGLQGGYGSPVAVGKHVYIAWWEPDTDSPVDDFAMEAARDKTPDRWRVLADEILLCMDIDTGKMVWKARFDGTGANDQFSNHCKNYTPIVADGAVVLHGNGGWVYCVEPEDGSLRWKARTGPLNDVLDAWHQAGRLLGDLRKPPYSKLGRSLPRPFSIDNPIVRNSQALIADGVVVVSDEFVERMVGGDGAALVGFDLQTGEERWRVPDCMDVCVSPVLWRDEAGACVIGVSRNRCVLVEIASGRVLWELTAADQVEQPLSDEEAARPPSRIKADRFLALSTPALWRNRLILGGANISAKRPEPWQTGAICWEFGRSGARLAWSLPRDPRYHARNSSWVINGDRVLCQGQKGIAVVSVPTGELLSFIESDRQTPVGGVFSAPLTRGDTTFEFTKLLRWRPVHRRSNRSDG